MGLFRKFLDLDKEALLFFNGLGSAEYDKYWIFISEKWTWYPVYFLLLMILFHLYGFKKLLFILLFIILAIVISDQITVFIIREWVERPRPCFEPDLSKTLRLPLGCSGTFGFWSAHASNAFALAVFLGNIMQKKIKYSFAILLIWAGLTAYSRMYLGLHYPTDILCGSIFGALVGFSLYKIFMKIFPKFHLNKR